MYRKNTSRASRVSGKISITLLGFLILGSLILLSGSKSTRPPSMP